MAQFFPILMFVFVCCLLLTGFPVAFTLGGSALICALIATATGHFDPSFFSAIPSRIYGIMTNQTLLAVPLFVMMGVTLERSKVADELLNSMGSLFSSLQGGMAASVIIVGMLLAASTGIVGATVITMGLISLPAMLKHGYSPQLATGTICATGTLGQIIPPSIALILLGDVLSSAYQQSQLSLGIFNPKSLSVGDLFLGALIPGLILVAAYLVYALIASQLGGVGHKKNNANNKNTITQQAAPYHYIRTLLPPLILIFMVLGSILTGKATTTEASAVGALGAMMLAGLKRRLNLKALQTITTETAMMTCMVFMILIGSTVFSLVFRGLGGEELVNQLFQGIPGGQWGALLVVMGLLFLLGFILDFIEITFIVIPIIGPVLLGMGIDPVWLGIMIAINLQTSFLTPPFGFALFYLRGVAPASVTTADIYKGVIPFVIIQILVLVLVAVFPALATWLPSIAYA